MTVEQIAEVINNNAPVVLQWALMALGSLVIIGYAYVKATPTKDDDKFLQNLETKPIVGMVLKLLVSFSPIQRKDNLEKFDDDDAKKEAATPDSKP